MNKNTLAKMCCPFDKSDLLLHAIERNVEDKVLLGYLNCKTCDRIFPIVSGVPIMTPDTYRDEVTEHNLYTLLQQHIGDQKIENFRLLPSQ